MASEKRKAQSADHPVKRSKSAPNNAESARSNTSTLKKSHTTSTKALGDRQPIRSSILQTEEKAFPRGGANVLTPLEYKQIKIDAEQDVLFEQNGAARVGNDEYSDVENSNAPVKSKDARKRTSKRAKGDKKSTEDQSRIKIQSLGYKTLAKGMLVLGQVSQVTAHDIALSLPNNLTGYVPMTSVSAILNTRISTLLEQAQDEPKDDEDDDDDQDIDLPTMFNVGQYLRAYVVSTSSGQTTGGATNQAKRHIELSIDPKLVNNALTLDDFVKNSFIQISVRSVEDHGIVADLGLENNSAKGFIAKKELGQSWDLAKVQEGQVLLCCVTGSASDGKVLKVSPDPLRSGEYKQHTLSAAQTVASYLPGTAAELLITEVEHAGITGKIMGLLDATVDVMHAGPSPETKYKPGQKVTTRVIYDFPASEDKKVAVSLLEHVTRLQDRPRGGKKRSAPLDVSATVQQAKVIRVEPTMGLFLDLGADCPGYAHISRLSDDKITNLDEASGLYAIGSAHAARVLSYNFMDGTYNMSLEESVLQRPYLRVQDVKIRELIDVTVQKLIFGATGVTGVIVQLCEGITGLIPQVHMADVQLQHPEKKFREGVVIKARVLSVDVEKKQIRLSAKKTLLAEQTSMWSSYDSINVDDESFGTVINILPDGAVLQFYGEVRAWLPVAEMSETFVQDPARHFRPGQTVKARVTQIDATAGKMKVSCKEQVELNEEQRAAWQSIEPGQKVTGIVTEITEDTLAFTLKESDLKAQLRVGHLTDKSIGQSRSASKRLRVGQEMTDLLVLDKSDKRRVVQLTCKPGMLAATKASKLPRTIKDLTDGQTLSGFVRNITPDGVFVEYLGGLVGYLPKPFIAKDMLVQPAFGLEKDQSFSCSVHSIDTAQNRFTLSLKAAEKASEKEKTASRAGDSAVVGAIDGTTKSIDDFKLGMQTQARVVSVKDTQLNVQLADNIQGRIDASELFDTWEQINDRKHPLQKFQAQQVLGVRILGIHDARNHRFLPITHRQARVPVFELSAKALSTDSDANEVLTLEKVKQGSSWIAFVNNISTNCLWVNLSPNVRGRIDLLDLSHELSTLDALSKHYPVGSAIRVKVKHVDAEKSRLDLVAASLADKADLTINDLSIGTNVPCRVIKTTDRAITVALNETITGVISLTEMDDDFEKAQPSRFAKNHILRACVIDLDVAAKNVYLSLRPSKLLSSALPVQDPSLTTISQLKPGQVLRGFVKVIQEHGIVVSLGSRLDAFVRVSDLSDSFVKDWASLFSVNQLVKGRIVAVHESTNHIRMSLKASQTDANYIAPRTLETLSVGQIVTGKVRKVAEFGVFVDVDNTQPRVSGLCHRSEIADSKGVNVQDAFDEGDAVKAKILAIDLDKRRISFGLKASYFADASDVDSEGEDGDVQMSDSESELGGIDLENVKDIDSASQTSLSDAGDHEKPAVTKPVSGLKTNGFDWTGAAMADDAKGIADDSEAETSTAPTSKKRRHRQATVYTDNTAQNIDPASRTASDFERLLLTSPHSSELWVGYMAFFLSAGEVSSARETGRRALNTIHIREQDEKLAVWTALLNLEVSYGSEESLAEVFAEASKMQDSFTIHERMADIFSLAGQLKKADGVYADMISKKEFRASTGLWITYATFLFDKMQDANKARGLLSRALQSVHEAQRRELTAKFAALEWKTSSGDVERGRTIFEGMLDQWPKWAGGWDLWLELERSRISPTVDNASAKAAKVDGSTSEAILQVRALFERMCKTKMKTRRAKTVFKRWLEFEEQNPERQDGHVDRVKALAKAYVEAAKDKAEEAGRISAKA